MSSKNYRKNTIRVQFKEEDMKPTNEEMFRFAATCNLTPTNVHTMAQDTFEKCIFIKFHNEELFKEFLENYNEVTFQYSNGSKTTVNITPAGGQIKYVRIFNLPSDIDETEIATELKKFGKISAQKKERYASNTGWPIFSGVRGLYMDVERDIPQILNIMNFRCRVYYDGQKDKCFKCGSMDHLKALCPNAGISYSQSVKNKVEILNEKTLLEELSEAKKQLSKEKDTSTDMINVAEFLNKKKLEKEIEYEMDYEEVISDDSRQISDGNERKKSDEENTNQKSNREKDKSIQGVSRKTIQKSSKRDNENAIIQSINMDPNFTSGILKSLKN